MIRFVLIVVCFIILILSISGCANRVAPSVQQRYLVVSATMQGSVDITNVRYFVFLKYNASSTAGPDLTSQYGHVLSASGATTSAQCIDNAPIGGLGSVQSNFNFDEFYEGSGISGTTSGTFINLNSSHNSAVIVTINPANTIQFSIPLYTASSPIGINVVTASASSYLIQDYLVSGTGSTNGYYLLTNVVGQTFTGSVPSNQAGATPPPPSADIISWSASII